MDESALVSTSQKSTIDKREVENYLNKTVTKFVNKCDWKISDEFGKKLVEQVNLELSDSCPSTEGFKFVVEVVLQEQFGQGSLVGAMCHWDNTRDSYVTVTMDTDKLCLSLAVFFVAIEEDEESSDEE